MNINSDVCIHIIGSIDESRRDLGSECRVATHQGKEGGGRDLKGTDATNRLGMCVMGRTLPEHCHGEHASRRDDCRRDLCTVQIRPKEANEPVEQDGGISAAFPGAKHLLPMTIGPQRD